MWDLYTIEYYMDIYINDMDIYINDYVELHVYLGSISDRCGISILANSTWDPTIPPNTAAGTAIKSVLYVKISVNYG
jgi:hypothetical protein